MCIRGYVALAVASEGGTVTREVETGSSDRANNMVEFAKAALELLKERLSEGEKL
jgi:hypothetical protein